MHVIVALVSAEETPIPAYIYGDRNVTQVVQLNRPALIRCPAGGSPVPHVSWWRNGHLYGMSAEQSRGQMSRDYSLFFQSIQLSDLGRYNCDAFNNLGRPVSLHVTLKAVGPVRPLSPEDNEYMQYVIEPVRAPENRRPAQPARPARPFYVPPPVVQNPISK